jgi:hypothetical protein
MSGFLISRRFLLTQAALRLRFFFLNDETDEYTPLIPEIDDGDVVFTQRPPPSLPTHILGCYLMTTMHYMTTDVRTMHVDQLPCVPIGTYRWIDDRIYQVLTDLSGVSENVLLFVAIAELCPRFLTLIVAGGDSDGSESSSL